MMDFFPAQLEKAGRLLEFPVQGDLEKSRIVRIQGNRDTPLVKQPKGIVRDRRPGPGFGIAGGLRRI